MSIENLTPQRVWKNFYMLTQIPRPSKHEGKVREFIVRFGKDLGLETLTDDIGNVIIRKPATAGMENRKGVILQAHLDMVPQKNSDTNHDFEKDPIHPYIDGEWVRARGTTLGADNGVGVAVAMAVLEAKDLVHGHIEALFTIDEETGMTGAFGLKAGLLKGEVLINLDSEDEGELYVGCAGGLDGSFTFTGREEAAPAGYEAFRLAVTGLKGGHSGMDIILGRGNANKVLMRFLHLLTTDFGARLSTIEGGNLRNAIPREAFALVWLPAAQVAVAKQAVAGLFDTIAVELSAVEGGLKVSLEAAEKPAAVVDEATQRALILAVYACPNGVVRMSDTMHGLVETSNNLAIVKLENGVAQVSCLLRSSVDSAKDDLANAMGAVFTLAGAQIAFTGGYPGWKPNPDSAILKTMKDVYQRMYGKAPEVKAIHAGLECGLLGGIYPHWDMISCGPTIRSPHSPDERLKIDTVEKWWNFLVETLKVQ
ncbi:MAG: aminoacyl-histidine dipeptidase [Prevotellaceae bacterium]|jgi:dipeptidase D|nr:aminoacyl-histidine dipeptidase [Prevotellaceae bacterium]